MSKSLDLYLVPTRKNRYVLFSPVEALQAVEADSGGRVHQFIAWFLRHPNRVVAWVGRVLHAGHGYYVQLEDKIDPAERVLKAMASANRFVVHHSRVYNEDQMRNEFFRFLNRQRRKHIVWFSIDLIISPLGVLMMPIPGPNVFFYYPFLRVLSHYRAIGGAASGLGSSLIEFKSLPELSSLEDNLPGLRTFLGRMD